MSEDIEVTSFSAELRDKEMPEPLAFKGMVIALGHLQKTRAPIEKNGGAFLTKETLDAMIQFIDATEQYMALVVHNLDQKPHESRLKQLLDLHDMTPPIVMTGVSAGEVNKARKMVEMAMKFANAIQSKRLCTTEDLCEKHECTILKCFCADRKEMRAN